MAGGRKRWIVLGAFWILQAASIYTLFILYWTGAGWGFGAGSDVWELWLAGFRIWQAEVLPVWSVILVITAAQAIFVCPVRQPGFRKRAGPSVVASMCAAGLAAAVLVTGVVVALAEVFWGRHEYFDNLSFPRLDALFWTAMLVSWAVATPLLIGFCVPRIRSKGSDSVLARLSAWLFLGTVVEAAAILPLDVMVRRRESCHCATGTFWALTMCLGVGAFALGPAVVLPIVMKRRRRWMGARCDVCGYDMKGLETAHRCPECGAGWKPGPTPG